MSTNTQTTHSNKMKINKIPHCQNNSNTTLSEQFQNTIKNK